MPLWLSCYVTIVPLSVQGRFAITVLPDTHPLTEELLLAESRANVIVLGGPDVNAFARLTAAQAPIRWEGGGGGGAYAVYGVGPYSYGAPGLGLLYLAPLGIDRPTTRAMNSSSSAATAGKASSRASLRQGQDRPQPQAPRLMLVVAGSDLQGMDVACSLVPIQSGLTLPDFIVVQPQFKWQGAGGVLAAGYYNNDWEVNEESASTYLRPMF